MVHTYSLNGYNIAIDGNSGAVHLLDDLTYQIIQDEKYLPSIKKVVYKLKSKFKLEEIEEAYKEIKLLEE